MHAISLAITIRVSVIKVHKAWHAVAVEELWHLEPVALLVGV